MRSILSTQDERRKKMKIEDKAKCILDGNTALGIELGSTRIKSVLLDVEKGQVLASGNYDWSNQLVDGFWSYGLDEVWKGIASSYGKLKEQVKSEYDVTLSKVGSMGISGMMHGYMVFDKKDELLVPFRTWRNNKQEVAAEQLSDLFQYPIPQRWSVAHLYQAHLNGESHLPEISFQTTLAGYIHWKLTGEKVLGVCEASGMFPIDIETGSFNKKMLGQFNELLAGKVEWKVEDILPKVLCAGEKAGALTKAGALLLDPAGDLEAGTFMCPPEGDAGTGMVATNSVAKRTGNVSAGTSVFAMIVLEKELEKYHKEIDQVTTPDGSLVAMVHSNNCSSNLDAWVGLIEEAVFTLGGTVDKDTLYGNLYRKALEGDADCGGLLSIGYLSGEHITGFEEGRPLFVRKADDNFNLANFMRANLYTALGALRIGMEVLTEKEKVTIDKMYGHGGFFKVEGVGNRIMAAAMNAPIHLMETAGEGGAWGMAVLAAYMMRENQEVTLEAFLRDEYFATQKSFSFEPVEEDVTGFTAFMENYKKGLAVERAAVENFN